VCLQAYLCVQLYVTHLRPNYIAIYLTPDLIFNITFIMSPYIYMCVCVRVCVRVCVCKNDSLYLVQCPLISETEQIYETLDFRSEITGWSHGNL
jgi:hypothetical protein